jgi:hypothetical protein
VGKNVVSLSSIGAAGGFGAGAGAGAGAGVGAGAGAGLAQAVIKGDTASIKIKHRLPTSMNTFLFSKITPPNTILKSDNLYIFT